MSFQGFFPMNGWTGEFGREKLFSDQPDYESSWTFSIHPRYGL